MLAEHPEGCYAITFVVILMGSRTGSPGRTASPLILKNTSQSCIIEIAEQDASPAWVEAAVSVGRGRQGR